MPKTRTGRDSDNRPKSKKRPPGTGAAAAQGDTQAAVPGGLIGCRRSMACLPGSSGWPWEGGVLGGGGGLGGSVSLGASDRLVDDGGLGGGLGVELGGLGARVRAHPRGSQGAGAAVGAVTGAASLRSRPCVQLGIACMLASNCPVCAQQLEAAAAFLPASITCATFGALTHLCVAVTRCDSLDSRRCGPDPAPIAAAG